MAVMARPLGDPECHLILGRYAIFHHHHRGKRTKELKGSSRKEEGQPRPARKRVVKDVICSWATSGLKTRRHAGGLAYDAGDAGGNK